MRDNIELTYNVYMFACSITFIVVLYFDFFFRGIYSIIVLRRE